MCVSVGNSSWILALQIKPPVRHVKAHQLARGNGGIQMGYHTHLGYHQAYTLSYQGYAFNLVGLSDAMQHPSNPPCRKMCGVAEPYTIQRT